MAVLRGGTAASQTWKDWYSVGCLVGSVCDRVLRGGDHCVARHELHSPPPEPEVKGAAPGFAKLVVKELTCS